MKRDYANPSAEIRYRMMLADTSLTPISFKYGDVVYNGISPKHFTLISEEKNYDTKKCLESNVREYSLDGALTVKTVWGFYPKHGVDELTVWFENKSESNTLVLSDVYYQLKLDGVSPMLRGIYGDHEKRYEGYVYDIAEGDRCFVSSSGRATHVNFPYFDLEYGDGGSMLAIGWAGTWTADFKWDGKYTTYTARSVNNLNTYLKPGESIRTALFVHAPYTVRDEFYAINFWRSWFIESNLPWYDDETPLHPLSTCFLAYDTGIPNSDGSISERSYTWRPSLEKILSEDLHMDIRWFDAGWYIAPDGTSPFSDWWGTVGTWELDRNKWPGDSFRQSTDFAREHDMRTMVWFEPERVTDPENLAKHYGYDLNWAIRAPGTDAISNNIGIPECLEWITNRIRKFITEHGVDIYREDNNCNPAVLWKYLEDQDEESRKGMTECKFIMGHYKMWDEIIACTKSNGGCGFCDSCASGGGRNDIESLRRGVPILRSDCDRSTMAIRLSMTLSFNRWIPYNGANTREKAYELDATGISDKYVWRCSYLPILNVDSQYVYEPSQNFDMLRFGMNEWKRVSPYLVKEYYPLTPWFDSNEDSHFVAYSYLDPNEEKGVLFAIRMKECEQSELVINIPYIGENEVWRLTDEDTGETFDISSNEFTVSVKTARSAKLFWIEKYK